MECLNTCLNVAISIMIVEIRHKIGPANDFGFNYKKIGNLRFQLILSCRCVNSGFHCGYVNSKGQIMYIQLRFVSTYCNTHFLVTRKYNI